MSYSAILFSAALHEAAAEPAANLFFATYCQTDQWVAKNSWQFQLELMQWQQHW
jgi:hypothetical protein